MGHPWRAWELIFRPSFTSVMAWMVWLYLIYLVLIMAKLWLDFRCELACFVDRQGKATWMYRLLTIGQNCPVNSEAMRSCVLGNRKWQRILSACGLPLAIAFSSGVGVLFGSLAARPYWHSGLLPVFFLIGALASGSALILVLDGLFNVVPPSEKEDVQKIKRMMTSGNLFISFMEEMENFS